MLMDSGAPTRLWAEAAVTACYIRNRSPVTNRDMTPWELFFKRAPDVSHFRAFGATAYVLVPKDLRRKLDSHTEKGIMVGYEPGTKGYRIYVNSGRVTMAKNVIFHELDGAFVNSKRLGSPMEEPQEDLQADTNGDMEAEEEASGQEQINANNPRRERRPPRDWWVVREDVPSSRRPRTLLAASAFDKDPATMEEALQSPDGDKWQEAIDEEYQSLLENDTWTLVDKPSSDVNIIPVKWVFKTKRGPTGAIERFKARLVAKGFRQKEGIDFEEVFAPVSKYTTFRMLLALVAAEDMELHQLDIKTAFLNGELQETVYTQQPPGYEQGTKDTVCHLRKTLYGLKQAPRAWHLKLKEELENLDFKTSDADPGFFIKEKDDSIIFALVYVDDILIAARSLDEATKAKTDIMGKFNARDMGEATFFLGLTIQRDRATRKIVLHQAVRVRELIARYGLEDSKGRAVPLTASVELTASAGEPLDTETFTYSNLVGSLLYIANCTRPDISQAVGVLAKYMGRPTTVHWTAAKGVLRYMAGTADFGLIYQGQSSIQGFADADFASDLDTRRSTTGYVFIMNGGAVSWSSKRQTTVAVSTTEAEYMAAAHAIKEALWIRKLLQDFKLDIKCIPMKMDNQSAIKVMKNPVLSLRSKHIDVIYNFARERVARGEVKLEYISTHEMIADALTKPVPRNKLEFCRDSMGVTAVAS